ncbi:MAG: VOC family protein [Caldimonas sp.]
MKLENARIAQLLVPVDDLAKAVAFYRDVLGLRFLFEAPPQMAFFDCGGVRLLVGVPPAGQAAARGSAIYFQVAEIGAVAATLEAGGVSFAAAPHVVHRTPDVELWLAEFEDPFGNRLALMSEVRSSGVAPAA